MDSSAITYYDINGQIGNANQQDAFVIHLTSASGNGDSVALALATAIGGIDLPPGVALSVSLIRNATQTETSFADLASTPPTFL